MDKRGGAVGSDVRRDVGGWLRKQRRERSYGDGESGICDRGSGPGVFVHSDGGRLNDINGAVDMYVRVHAAADHGSAESHPNKSDIVQLGRNSKRRKYRNVGDLVVERIECIDVHGSGAGKFSESDSDHHVHSDGRREPRENRNGNGLTGFRYSCVDNPGERYGASGSDTSADGTIFRIAVELYANEFAVACDAAQQCFLNHCESKREPERSRLQRDMRKD